MGFVENLKDKVDEIQQKDEEEFQGNNYLATPGNAPLILSSNNMEWK